MPPIAWRRGLRHRVTVKRNTTVVSASGATRFAYSVVAEHVQCGLQDAGGRQRQDDGGQVPARKKTIIFGPEAAAVVQQNDILVVEGASPAETYKVTHLHLALGTGEHLKGVCEQWVPGGEL